MIRFQEHPNFEPEFKKIAKKQPGAKEGILAVKKLLEIYFDPDNPNTSIIAPGKIHRLKEYTDWSLWKIEVMVKGLKPNLWPRVWFVVDNDNIVFLAANMHNSNYNDNEIERSALERYSN